MRIRSVCFLFNLGIAYSLAIPSFKENTYPILSRLIPQISSTLPCPVSFSCIDQVITIPFSKTYSRVKKKVFLFSSIDSLRGFSGFLFLLMDRF